MKGLLLVVCAAFVHVNGQCGCPKPIQCKPITCTCTPVPPAYCQPKYEAIALPSCNCPSVPSLPVSPTVLPQINAPPFSPFCSAPGVSCYGGLTLPLGLINPFLPAASPISALAPTVSNLYPPINPCNCGCKYLKKIPIPPPCI